MKYFRISVFVILGILLQQLIHHLVELWYIDALIRDFDKYGLGLTWENWFLIHHVGSFVLLALGVLFGYALGRNYVK